MIGIVDRLRGNDPVAPLRLFREQQVTITANVLLDAADEIEKMTADTMTKDQTIRLQAAEIENLRARVYYVSPGSPFAPEGITWQQEANRLLDALADEQELRLGPK